MQKTIICDTFKNKNMSKVRFIGCLHMGHKNMAIHRGWADEEEHNAHLIGYRPLSIEELSMKC